jgi:hypothetical protein
MILCPSRSHANADNAKDSIVTPVATSSHVDLEVGTDVNRSPIAIAFLKLGISTEPKSFNRI